MKILKFILFGLLAVIVVLVVVSFFLPSKLHVERKNVVHAPAPVVYGLVSDLHSWSEWDPWSGQDPDMKVAFEGPQAGQGSVRKWESKKMGNGSMTITNAVPNQKVEYVVDFGGKQKSPATMVLNPTDGGTEVAWSMDLDFGANPLYRLMGLFADKMIGPDFEKGLQNLDNVATKLPPPAPEPTVPTEAVDSTGEDMD